mmetsp:Transcript_6140/g.17074  ORF Transcript_6140/g.17074 Transcript_6140/m.17074 type:complete len:316 (-) Transcript_6140:394-1341(-)
MPLTTSICTGGRPAVAAPSRRARAPSTRARLPAARQLARGPGRRVRVPRARPRPPPRPAATAAAVADLGPGSSPAQQDRAELQAGAAAQPLELRLVAQGDVGVVVILVAVDVVDLHEATLTIVQPLDLVLQRDADVAADLERSCDVHEELDLHHAFRAEMVSPDQVQLGVLDVLGELADGRQELVAGLHPDELDALLRGRAPPRSDDVTADEDPANRVHPPGLLLDARETREQKRRGVGEDVVEIVERQGLQRHVAGPVVFDLGYPPHEDLHDHDGGEHDRRDEGEVHLGASREARVQRAPAVVYDGSGSEDHQR